MAKPESTIANARHAVGDGDGGKGGVIRENPCANARHAVGDGDGGKGGAIIVSITDCISTLLMLNGRKVKP